jgi:hypothetical protein
MVREYRAGRGGGKEKGREQELQRVQGSGGRVQEVPYDRDLSPEVVPEP